MQNTIVSVINTQMDIRPNAIYDKQMVWMLFWAAKELAYDNFRWNAISDGPTEWFGIW